MKKTLRKAPDFPRCSAKRKRRGGHIKATSSFSSAHQGDTSVFLSLVCIIMASQRALLVVYLVSLVYVRSAKCLGREEAVFWEGEVGRHTPVGPDPEASLYSQWPGVNSAAPNPTRGELSLGKNNLLFDQLFKKKKKERKETASLSADSLFNQLHKKCTEKIRTILYRYMWPALLRKLLSNEETLNNAVL